MLGLSSLALAAAACSDTPDGSSAVGTVSPSVIYGGDDRDDVYAHDDTERAQAAADFTVALVWSARVDTRDPTNVRLSAQTFEDAYSVCASERFLSQPTAAFCSGTLIAPDLVLTAGHCVGQTCAGVSLVFNYYMTSATALQTITVDDVFECSAVVVQQLDEQLDYAILRLDRPAQGREPATMTARAGPLPVGTDLVISGFPAGLPIKIADGAAVRSSESDMNSFIANLDAYEGNSGSGVFEAQTDALVGILSSGEQDFTSDVDAGCNRSVLCTDDGCTGEVVIDARRAIEGLCETAPVPSLCNGCGDNVCDTAAGETTVTCPFDCGTNCGDGACNGDESPVTCADDCGTCGNQICDAGESSATCCVDCGCGAQGRCFDNTCFAGGDVCGDAQVLEVQPRQVVSGNTAVANHDYEPDLTCTPVVGDSRDVAFQLSLSSPSRVRASVFADFDTVLYLRSDCRNPASDFVCNDDREVGVDVTSAIDVRVPAGTAFLVVDGFASRSAGPFQLEVFIEPEDDGGCACIAAAPSGPSWGVALTALLGLGCVRLRRARRPTD